MNNLTAYEATLKFIQEIYQFNDFKRDKLIQEPEHSEYGAYTFQLNKNKVKFRVAKITPTKPGCFVTLWKRNELGETIPHDISDPFDLYIIHVAHSHYGRGQFIFTKKVLAKKNILSKNLKGGKRGFRLYPAWEQRLNPQANKTQQWQLPYFVEMKDASSVISKHLLEADA